MLGRIRARLLMIGLLGASILLATPTAYAIDAALTLEGGAQGPIQGENTTPDRKDTIAILGYSDSLVVPSTAQGQIGGGPECRPLTIRKLMDRTTPLLAQAFATSEIMSVFELRFYRPNGGGTVNWFTIELDNPVILSISRAGGEDDDQPQEQVTFGFTDVLYRHDVEGVVRNFSCTGGPPPV